MMVDKQAPVASIAWYKLADLIARGEREKALSVYRLLAHSFDDKAYALQLEGDILFALDDNRAKEKYFQAAVLYKKEQRWVDAVAVGQHLLSQQPDDVRLMFLLVYCYAVLDYADRCESFLQNIVRCQKAEPLDEAYVIELTQPLLLLAQEKKWLVELLEKHLDKFV